jgi:hypothetical protein
MDWFKYAEKCDLPKLMSLLKNSNSTTVKCEQYFEKLLKIRPLTYTQIQLLKQKEDEMELEEVKKIAFINTSSTTVETPLSFEKEKKDELQVLTQSVEEKIALTITGLELGRLQIKKELNEVEEQEEFLKS